VSARTWTFAARAAGTRNKCQRPQQQTYACASRKNSSAFSRWPDCPYRTPILLHVLETSGCAEPHFNLRVAKAHTKRGGTQHDALQPSTLRRQNHLCISRARKYCVRACDGSARCSSTAPSELSARAVSIESAPNVASARCRACRAIALACHAQTHDIPKICMPAA
jgi:hypothetical protein